MLVFLGGIKGKRKKTHVLSLPKFLDFYFHTHTLCRYAI